MREFFKCYKKTVYHCLFYAAAGCLALLLFSHPALSETGAKGSLFSHNEKEATTQAAPLTPEQALNRKQISDLQLSPNGNRIAFVVTDPVKGTKYNRNIWIYYVMARKLQRFTTSDADSHPRWSPHNKTLAFLSGRKENNQIYLIPPDGGEAEALTQCKTGVQSFEWSPDGSRIAFLSLDPKTEEQEKKLKEKDDEFLVLKDDRHTLTGEKLRISGRTWSTDGNHLIIAATNHPQPELFTDRIYSVAVSDGKMQEISRPKGPFSSLKVSPDGKTIAYIGCRTDGPQGIDLIIQPISGGKSLNLTGSSLDRSISSYIWLQDGSLMALATTGFTDTFYKVFKDGRVKKLSQYHVNPYRFFVKNEKVLAFIGQTAIQAPELWVSLQPGKAEKVTHFNAEWENIPLTQPEFIHYPSFDGKKIEAALLKPAGFKDGMRVPFVVVVHGGPTGRFSDGFQAWSQLLAARGYGVLLPNIRGSSGYGYEFMILNRYDWGGGDWKDVMAGVDYVIKEGIADPERLGIGGWSYGGYMAAWAVTQTDRFKVSVSGAPVIDLAVEYGTETPWINFYDDWFVGSPYEDMDQILAMSPMTHVKNVKTPTLILCGEEDANDPIAQCYQFHRGLRRYGVETDFVVYPREPHGPREEKHKLDVLNRMIAWFDKYLK